MSNSKLVDMVNYSPNHSGRRTHPISKIAIHHTAGAINASVIGEIFKKRSRQASCNYGIGRDKKVILCVDEANRSWCTSSAWCDNRAVTIEVANSQNGGSWPVSNEVLEILIQLVTDICRRNGIRNCSYTGDKNGVLQKHEWYANTTCPGPYLGSKFPYISQEVNRRLKLGPSSESGGLYRVRRAWTDVKSQKGAFRVFANAKASADQYKGYGVYDENGIRVYPKDLKSNEQIAREVIQGKWGNGADRKERLQNAGYSYGEVQRLVNEILGY